MCQLEFHIFHQRKAQETLFQRAAAVYLYYPHNLQDLPSDLCTKLENTEINLGTSRGYWKREECEHCLENKFIPWAKPEDNHYCLYNVDDELPVLLRVWLELHGHRRKKELVIHWFPCEKLSDTDAWESLLDVL